MRARTQFFQTRTVAKTDLSSALTDSDQEDWDLEILQALISPSTAEDAALACAAAWMNFLQAERVAVVIFDSSTSCIVAHGQRDNNTHITIYVGNEKSHIGLLLQPEDLCAENGPCVIESPTDVVCWPEHLSAVVAIRDDASEDEERTELIKNLSRKLLSRWTTPRTSFANPDHMESMAEFAAGAGHEINNPLGSIIGQTQLLLKRTDRADQKQSLETIGSQAWRIRDMIGDTMLFARPPQPEFAECNLAEISGNVVSTLNEKYGDKRRLIEFHPPQQQVPTFADESQISILVSHLVSNACEAVAELENGNARVSVSVEHVANYATVIVEDNGPEIPASVRQHMFDPFYSGRQAGRGLGFGLCHSWQIVRMHNGILMQEVLSTGNRFVVVLPLDAALLAKDAVGRS